jgi:hypothetical protein
MSWGIGSRGSDTVFRKSKIVLTGAAARQKAEKRDEQNMESGGIGDGGVEIDKIEVRNEAVQMRSWIVGDAETGIDV